MQQDTTTYYRVIEPNKLMSLCTITALAMGVGIAVFTGVAMYLANQEGEQANNASQSVLIAAACVLSVFGAIGPALFKKFIFKRLLQEDRPARDVAFIQLPRYLTYKIMSYAAIESGALLWAVMIIIFRDPIYALGSLGGILLLIANRPSSTEIASIFHYEVDELAKELED